ncbi:hypothetical protein TNCV_2949451 [Trichonephila clavipes]|nr:hypothetical protein TNCV_2949451 [Trichonephila clavipes]
MWKNEKQQCRHILLFKYRIGKNAVQVTKKNSMCMEKNVSSKKDLPNSNPTMFMLKMHYLLEGQLKLKTQLIKAYQPITLEMTERQMDRIHGHLKRSDFISKLDNMYSSCSYRKKFVPSH